MAVKESSPCFLLVLGVQYLILFNFCEWYKIAVQFHSSARGYLVFPPPFIANTVLSSLGLNYWLPCQMLPDCIQAGLFLAPSI